MDDSKTQQTDNNFTDNAATTRNDGSQGGLTMPLPERASDNDDNHDEEGSLTFVLGYN